MQVEVCDSYINGVLFNTVIMISVSNQSSVIRTIIFVFNHKRLPETPLIMHGEISSKPLTFGCNKLLILL